MKLKLRLALIGGMTVVAGAAVTVLAVASSQLIRADTERLTQAHGIEQAAADVVIVTQEFALHNEERAREQWHARLADLVQRSGSFPTRTAAERRHLDDLALRMERIARQFTMLVDRLAVADPALAERARRLLTGQMLVESYAMTSAASRLAQEVTALVEEHQQRGATLAVAIIASLVLGVLAATVATWRGIVSGLDRLHRGTQRVADGDFSVRVREHSGRPVDELDELAAAIDRSSAELDLQRGLLTLSQQLSTAANASSDVNEALRAALRTICDFAGWPVAHALLAPRPGAAIVSTGLWLPEDEPRYERLRAVSEAMRYDDDHVGVVASTLLRRELQYIAEVDAHSNPYRHDAVREAGLRGHVALPVLLGDEVAAVLEFFLPPGAEPRPGLLATLEQGGVQLGRVLERERARVALSEEARMRARSLLALSARIATAANEGATLPGVLEQTLTDVCRTAGWAVGHALRVDGPASRTLVSLHTWYLLDPVRFARFREHSEALQVSIDGAGSLAEALREGVPAVSTEITEAVLPHRYAVAGDCGLRGHLVVPMPVGREVVALVEFLSIAPMTPEPGMLELLRNAGLQLGRVVERERARAALNERAEALARSNAELESFAYVASHDLQEPLRMVASYAQLLERRYGDKLDEKGRRYVGYAVEGAIRMQHLVNGLLQISRVDRHDEPPADVDLQRLLGRLLRDLSPLLAENQARLHFADLPVVRAEPEQLAQVLRNLITNAVKFHRPQVAPEVWVTAERRERMWCVSVRDNGIGIEPRHHARIFQIFQRLHSRQAYEGLGIGLTLCKKLVERNGGRIWVEPSTGEGATFCFTVPATAA